MIKAHKIRLNPNSEQKTYFYRASGVARFAWNWALDEYERRKAAGQEISWNEIKFEFRARIETEFPFVREVTKCVAELAIADLRQAINTYYKTTRKKKGSNNRMKWKLKIGRAHERVSNLRGDFLHKFTSEAPKRFSIVCVEDLCLKGWVGLAGKSTHDAGVGRAINQLRYKTEEVGGKLQKVGRYFASSKRCHECGYIKEDLELREREWKCPNCGAEHDRDENGAINIEMEGVSLLAGSGYIGETPVEFAATALKRGKDLASLAST
jgi:transposase